MRQIVEVAPSYLKRGTRTPRAQPGLVLSDLTLLWDLPELCRALHRIAIIIIGCFGEGDSR